MFPTIYTKKDVQRWLDAPNLNPITNHVIQEGGPTWRKLKNAKLNYEICYNHVFSCPEKKNVELKEDEHGNIHPVKQPKRPQTAFNYWLKSLSAVKRKEEIYDDLHKEWLSLSDKEKWKEMEEKDRQRFTEEITIFQAYKKRLVEKSYEKSYETDNNTMLKPTLKPLPNQLFICKELDRNHHFVVVNDTVGSGKTAAVLLWIFQQKEKGANFRSRIIVPRHILSQWTSDLEEYFKGALSFKSVDSPINYTEEAVDVLICTEKTAQVPFRNHYTVYDELTTIKRRTTIKNCIPLPAIVITGDKEIMDRTAGSILNATLKEMYISTPLNLCLEFPQGEYRYSGKHLQNLIRRICTSYFSRLEMDELPLINSSLSLNFEEPIVKEHFFNYRISFIHDATKFLPKHIVSMIKKNELPEVLLQVGEQIKELAGIEITTKETPPHDILYWIKLVKMGKLQTLLVNKIKAVESGKSAEALVLNLSVQELQTEIEKVESKFSEVLRGECEICRIKPILNPVFYQCCQHLICIRCAEFLPRCPFCRNLYPKRFASNTESEKTDCNVIAEIVNKAQSVIIYRTRGLNTEEKWEKDIEGKVGYLNRTQKHREETIQSYKKGDIKALYLSESDYGGLALENTTDIIFMENDIKPIVKDKVIGRALRLGRDPKLPLTLHFLHPTNA